MSAVGAVVGEVVDQILKLARDQSTQKMVLGTYSDGTTRSIPDAVNGEVMSSKDKKKAILKADAYKNGKKKKAKLHL